MKEIIRAFDLVDSIRSKALWIVTQRNLDCCIFSLPADLTEHKEKGDTTLCLPTFHHEGSVLFFLRCRLNKQPRRDIGCAGGALGGSSMLLENIQFAPDHREVLRQSQINSHADYLCKLQTGPAPKDCCSALAGK